MSIFSSNKNFDLIAIGDTAVDAFIKLNEAKTKCDDKGRKCELSLKFGDKISYESMQEIKAVGNSANASVCASRLGLKSALVTNLGGDRYGEESLLILKDAGVSTKFVNIQKNKKTNYHFVLWFQDDRTILVKHQKYDYEFENIGNPKWVYLSSLGEGTIDYHKQIANHLRNNRDIKLAFQPGTFQMKMGLKVLGDIYLLSNILFCNVEEAKTILDKPNEKDIKVLLKSLHNIGPQIVVITDGPKGAYGYDGYEGFYMPIYPDVRPPFERTGAGDAFASTVVSAISMGKSLFDAFMWAPINSMSVVQYVGAQKGLLTKEEILKFLSKAPRNYYPEKII